MSMAQRIFRPYYGIQINLDFRPKPDSILIDNGKSEEPIPAGYIGQAPDMGAYEFGANDYWIPGRKEAGALSPSRLRGLRT